MNLLDCESDLGPLTRFDARLAWQMHRYCDREVCRVRRRARVILEGFVSAAGGFERDVNDRG